MLDAEKLAVIALHTLLGHILADTESGNVRLTRLAVALGLVVQAQVSF